MISKSSFYKVNNYKNIQCPPKNEQGWNLHPKVYLKIKEGETRVCCPYCGNNFEINIGQNSKSFSTVS